MSQPKIFNDNWTLEDQIGHCGHVKSMADVLLSCEPPYVLGIHGDWGAGKTSFLRKLHLYCSGEGCGYNKANDFYEQHWGGECKDREKIEAIWFDAWHYQFDKNPAVALLNEIRAHFTLSKKFFGKAEKLTYAALMALDDLSKKIGASPSKIMAAGEKWEKEHFTQPLPSQMVKDLMEDAIENLLGKEGGKRLMIFVDDLDRCTGPVAFKFLEAMKVYFSLANCVFILGLDIRHIRRAVAAELKIAGIIPDVQNESQQVQAELCADDYLGKIFQHVFYLPDDTNYMDYLEHLLETNELNEWKEWASIIFKYKILPPNPRKIKSFINGLSLYIDQLKQRIEEFNKGKKSDSQVEFDKELALIFAYLKINAHDLYRILVHEPDFWEKRLKEFCLSGENNNHWALQKLTPIEKSVPLPGETGNNYESLFQDPSNESLFRIASLIREKEAPTDDEFNLYLFR